MSSVLLVPSLASAQSLAGAVRDSSGGVLPGVTVEASSPALITKVRTSVTDDSGQYRIHPATGRTVWRTNERSGHVLREGVRFWGKRANVGLDLYNLFNSNTPTTYESVYADVAPMIGE